MRKSFEAVYENGVLRPLEVLPLSERQPVHVTIDGPALSDAMITEICSLEEWTMASQDDISLEETRAALASIPGALSDDVIALRDER